MTHPADKAKPYLIVWRDSSSLPGWRYTEYIEDPGQVSPIVTIARLLREDESSFTFTHSVGGWGNVMDPLTIPKENICEMKPIRLPKVNPERWRVKTPRRKA